MSGAGLTNADFRALLATPRPGGGGGGGGGGGAKKKHKKPNKPGPNFKPGGKLGVGKEGEDGDEGAQYRDRAAERRKGLSADFEGVPDDLVGLLAGKGDTSRISYEDSKYLGGDVAHTHLVKGLDFALLQKVRAEQEAKKRGGGAESDEEDAQPVLAKTVQIGGAQQQPTFQTPMGRAVHDFFFNPKQRGPGVPVAELFLPRRTAFVYELEEPEAPDVPTTLRRSKEDCPKVQESLMGVVDTTVLGKIAKIMSYMTLQGGGKKKLKRREREALLQQHGIQLAGQVKHAAGAAQEPEQGGRGRNGQEQPPPPPPPAAAPVDEDDDIFGDAGTDYQPTVKDKQKAAAAAAAQEQQRKGGYFGGAAEDLHADLPPLPAEDAPPPPPPLEDGDMMGPAAGPSRPPAGYDAGAAYAPYPEADAYPPAAEEAVAAVVRSEKQKEKRRAADLLRGDDDDAYAECYPSYYDAGTVLEDSDDEGAARGAEQPQAMTRRDFASEADWEEYQASGMPSRQAEGRAKVRQQQRDSQKEKNKISSQLGKIQKIMEDKGYDHAAAFASARQRQAEGGDDGEGGGGGGRGFGTKKRRI